MRLSVRRASPGARRGGRHLAVRPVAHTRLTAQEAAARDTSPRPVGVSGLGGATKPGAGRSLYVETYGCQMNVSDSEIVQSVLDSAGYTHVDDPLDADVILLNTCAIRDKAERKVWQRLAYFRSITKRTSQAKVTEGEAPVVGVLGCMAERVKDKLLEADRLADLVAGPDAYRDLPNLIDAVRGGSKAMNVQLSAEETYGDIVPVRRDGGVGAFVTIMRGCDNLCTFCIVPYTRGRERSRDVESVLYECRLLAEQGVKEITLLGQNVNSYAADKTAGGAAQVDFLAAAMAGGVGGGGAGEAEEAGAGQQPYAYAEGFTTRYDVSSRRDGAVRFAELLGKVADIDPEVRVRFTSPHPKDFPDEVLDVIASRPNVCTQLHMPLQSGSDAVLERMRRGYTREAYLALVKRARERVPGVGLTTDVISGFCGETEEDHAHTVGVMAEVGFDQAFMFAYSEREGTAASKTMADDVEEPTKTRRLEEVIAAFREACHGNFQSEVGRRHCVLVEGPSKRDEGSLMGRTDTGKVVVFKDVEAEARYGSSGGAAQARVRPGDYAAVDVVSATTGTLHGELVGRTTLQGFQGVHGRQWAEAEELSNAAAR